MFRFLSPKIVVYKQDYDNSIRIQKLYASEQNYFLYDDEIGV